MNDSIQQEITIQAPMATVWQVITKPEHISKWFCDEADIDLQPGGKGSVKWNGFGEAPIEVIEVTEPTLFSFRWVAPDPETQGNQKTLVAFQLSDNNGGTTLRVTESEFSKMQIPDEDKASLMDKHTPGWGDFLEKISQYATTL
jgi:uncharacterized protein YndB with AHSA1/START domain